MILFTEDMKIGVPHIDLQHKSLVDFANKAAALSVSNPTGEEMKECLDFLGDYVVRHFDDEEKLQIESKYPRYRQHKEIHREFTETFKDLYEQFQKNGLTDEISYILTKHVTNWIITHIKMEDKIFGKYYTITKTEHLKRYT